MLLKTFGCVYTMYTLAQVVVHKLARNPCKGHLRAIRVDSNSDEMVVELENCRSILDFNTHLLAKCKGEIKSVKLP